MNTQEIALEIMKTIVRCYKELDEDMPMPKRYKFEVFMTLSISIADSIAHEDRIEVNRESLERQTQEFCAVSETPLEEEILKILEILQRNIDAMQCRRDSILRCNVLQDERLLEIAKAALKDYQFKLDKR